MKLRDRLLILRRAALIAINPKVEVLIIQYLDKDGEIKSRYIHSDKKKASEAFMKHMIDGFAGNAKSAQGLENIIVNFCNNVQAAWNEKHPDNRMNIVSTVEVDDDGSEKTPKSSSDVPKAKRAVASTKVV